jgi:hypothetical protein
MKYLKDAITAIAPMTSQGNFGIEGMKTTTTQRGQDILAASATEGHKTTERGQDILGKAHAESNANNALYHAGMLQHGKDELGIQSSRLGLETEDHFNKLLERISPKTETIGLDGGKTVTIDEQAGLSKLKAMGVPIPEKYKKMDVAAPAPKSRAEAFSILKSQYPTAKDKAIEEHITKSFPNLR